MRLTSNVDRNGGHNTATDNFFTNKHFTGLLSQQNVTTVGKFCANSKGLPRKITRGQEEKFFSTNSASSSAI